VSGRPLVIVFAPSYATFHSRTIGSSPPVASIRPSGLNATVLTCPAAMEQWVGAPAERAMAQVAHARVLRARSGRGDRGRALGLAEQAARTARRLGMAPTLASATDLIYELTGASPDAVASLTAREREVALLVADGLANRAIAEQLAVSERTVETHVRHVLTKLGLTNRTQVAAWTLRAGLRN
jgi:DNA-binding CsgD family transcriptional regulator